MPATDDYDAHDDPGWFRDQLRQRDRLIAELRSEQDEANDLIRRLTEHAEDYDAVLENWRDVFDMELTDDGWSWQPFWDRHHWLEAKYTDLVRQWNKYVTQFNTQPVGRPLAASEAQVVTVRRLRKAGKSLRWIADETSLSLQTVRTILDRDAGTDRTTKRRRIEIDRDELRSWKRKKREGDALPKRVAAVIETGQALVTEAKGLGRGR